MEIKEQVIELLEDFSMVYGVDLAGMEPDRLKRLVNLWGSALSDYPPEQIERGKARALKKCYRMPTIADMLQAIKDSRTAEEVYGRL